MKIIELPEIKKQLENVDLIPIIEQGFVEHTNGQIISPPVGELIFDNPPGDAHIKYGYSKKSNYYVIKIASGFYKNPKLGLPSANGLILLFHKQTGLPSCLLNDGGYLTNVRTAIAGAIAAKYLAPKRISAIGIVGTGTQAKLQLQYLQQVTSCKTVFVYGRSERALKDFDVKNYQIFKTTNLTDITNNCNLIVTTTPAKNPLLTYQMLNPGTHITAIGSDTAEKQELASNILANADIVTTDCKQQARTRGEIYRSKIAIDDVNEIGTIIQNKSHGRSNDSQITVADFTGIVAQDIKIAEHMLPKLNRSHF